jgi:hypothetical protein
MPVVGFPIKNRHDLKKKFNQMVQSHKNIWSSIQEGLKQNLPVRDL